MQLQSLSHRYTVRQLMETDVDAMLALCSGNPQFYRYHPPMATKASILDDLQAVPPGKTLSDKYFIGFYDGETLAAMMDLITGYPNPATAYIGLFMVDAAQQGRGTGSALIADCKQALRAEQFKTLRLAIDEGNPQSKAFWQKNGFALTGQRTPNENGVYLTISRMRHMPVSILPSNKSVHPHWLRRTAPGRCFGHCADHHRPDQRNVR